MNNSFTSFFVNVITKFKYKEKSDKEKLDIDDLNCYDVATTPNPKTNLKITMDQTDHMKQSIKDEMSAFFLDTSFTALTQIYKANSLYKRIVWTVIVIAMLVWMTVQCCWLLEKYYRYPVELKIDLKVSTILDFPEFPSVTICNLNPILKTNVNKDPFKSLVKYVNPDDDDPLYRETTRNYNENCDQLSYKCKDGICIDTNYVCNGQQNCENGEDEENCEDYKCPSYFWKCTSTHKCLPLMLRCNGYPGDCNMSTTEDEDNCENNTCPDDFFRCSSGRCIYSEWICDNITDCYDDETDCSDTMEYEESPKGESTFLPEPHTMSSPTATSLTAKDSRTTNLVRRKREINGESQSNLSKDKFWLPKERFRRNNHYNFTKRKVGDKDDVLGDIKGQQEHSAHRRIKRNSRGITIPNIPSTQVDPDTMLQNTSFKKWNALSVNGSSNYYEERDDEYEAAMTYAYITAKLNSSYLEQWGHLKIDMIATCKFGGYQCSPMNFTYSHNHKYGNCYTFNSKFDQNQNNLTTRFPGPQYGLKLELFLDQINYVANLAPDAGARILVHKKGSMPFLEDEGISIMPGRSTSIGIKKVSYSRLPPPHGSCGDTGGTTDYYRKYLGTDYSKLSCLKSCYQDMAIRYCGCAVPFYYVQENITVCNMTDTNIEFCVNRLPQDHPESYEICDKLCPIPCIETKYAMSVSSASWPSDTYKSYLHKRLNQTNFLYRQTNDSDKEFTKLQIYFQGLIYKQVVQQKAYESMSLISDFGGQLGLWLGLSAITIGEICSFLFGVCRSLLYRCWCQKIRPIHNGLSKSIQPEQH